MGGGRRVSKQNTPQPSCGFDGRLARAGLGELSMRGYRWILLEISVLEAFLRWTTPNGLELRMDGWIWSSRAPPRYNFFYSCDVVWSPQSSRPYLLILVVLVKAHGTRGIQFKNQPNRRVRTESTSRGEKGLACFNCHPSPQGFACCLPSFQGYSFRLAQRARYGSKGHPYP